MFNGDVKSQVMIIDQLTHSLDTGITYNWEDGRQIIVANKHQTVAMADANVDQ